ncbi:hypothetical protein HZC09_06190 [Candidatus Micrarchaeota archaeon]|nr:hypothetical protein [Candidatus Micrarchaeota archaeon]
MAEQGKNKEQLVLVDEQAEEKKHAGTSFAEMLGACVFAVLVLVLTNTMSVGKIIEIWYFFLILFIFLPLVMFLRKKLLVGNSFFAVSRKGLTLGGELLCFYGQVPVKLDSLPYKYDNWRLFIPMKKIKSLKTGDFTRGKIDVETVDGYVIGYDGKILDMEIIAYELKDYGLELTDGGPGK